MTCPSCGAAQPDDARFCIECGAELAARANTGATTTLPRDGERAVVCRACGAASPEAAAFCVRCGRRLAGGVAARPIPAPLFAPGRPWAMGPGGAARLSGAVFLAGLGLLLLLKLPVFPLILIAVGLSAFVHMAARGHAAAGLAVALWLFCVVFLFRVPRLLVPGMLALGVIAVVARATWRRVRYP